MPQPKTDKRFHLFCVFVGKLHEVNLREVLKRLQDEQEGMLIPMQVAKVTGTKEKISQDKQRE